MEQITRELIKEFKFHRSKEVTLFQERDAVEKAIKALEEYKQWLETKLTTLY